MRSLRLLYLGLTAAFAVLQWLSVAPAAPLDDLIAAAKKEGVLDFYGPSTLKADGAEALAHAFNKKYGTNINVKFLPSGSMTRDVGKVASQAATRRRNGISWLPPMPIMRAFGSASFTNRSTTNPCSWTKN
jgi:ABC-type glycerol-3-phosphate transport system substrate-binding protein